MPGDLVVQVWYNNRPSYLCVRQTVQTAFSLDIYNITIYIKLQIRHKQWHNNDVKFITPPHHVVCLLFHHVKCAGVSNKFYKQCAILIKKLLDTS